MSDLECHYTNRGVLSGPPLVYLIGDKKTEGKYWVKTWTAVLADICHPGSPKVKLGQENYRENEGWIIRDRERKEIFIQATIQDTTSRPSRCLGFRRISDIREYPTLFYQFFHSFLV